jgi:DNA-binding transcriptional MerR regulator
MSLTKPWSIFETSEQTGVPVNTLRHYRKIGIGPKSYRLGGRVVYDPDDVEAWIRKCRAEADSTS